MTGPDEEVRFGKQSVAPNGEKFANSRRLLMARRARSFAGASPLRDERITLQLAGTIARVALTICSACRKAL
jgi:hypothetical protein